MMKARWNTGVILGVLLACGIATQAYARPPTVEIGTFRVELVRIGRVMDFDDESTQWADKRMNKSRERLMLQFRIRNLTGEEMSSRTVAYGMTTVNGEMGVVYASFMPYGKEESPGKMVTDLSRVLYEVLMPSFAARKADVELRLEDRLSQKTLNFRFQDVVIP